MVCSEYESHVYQIVIYTKYESHLEKSFLWTQRSLAIIYSNLVVGKWSYIMVCKNDQAQ